MVLRRGEICGEPCSRFESDVKMYGTQANFQLSQQAQKFESDVKMYGTQAPILQQIPTVSLRVM